MIYKHKTRSATAHHWQHGLLVTMFVLLAADSAIPGALVTSIDGEAKQGEDRLSMHDGVDQHELLEMQNETRCSLLLSEGVVLQACNGAALRLLPGRRDESQIVELLGGELKASVGRRPIDDPLEIHTPAAIATILGTTLHVRVDPETGDTTITSLQNRIRVESSEPDVEGSVTIEAGEEVVVRKGRAPSPKRRVDLTAMSGASDCIDDARFHQVAVQSDRERREAELLDAITAFDIPPVLPPVSGPGFQDGLGPIAGATDPPIGIGGAITEGGGVCQTTDCALFNMPFEVPLPALPPPCAGPPGEQCSF